MLQWNMRIKAIKITKRIHLDPYFSSSSGPTTKIIIRLPKRWFQSACPKTCPKNLTYVNKSVKEERYTLKMYILLLPPLKMLSIKARKQRALNVRITGELKDIPFFLPLLAIITSQYLCYLIRYKLCYTLYTTYWIILQTQFIFPLKQY